MLPLVLMSLSVTDMASWADLSKVSRKFRGNVAVNEITRTARITDSFRDSLWGTFVPADLMMYGMDSKAVR